MADGGSFPWEMFLKAQAAKNQNRQQMYQDIAGMGQAVNNRYTSYSANQEEKKQKEQWAKAVNEAMNNPNASPQMKQLLPLIAANPSLAGQLGPGLLKTEEPPATIYYDASKGRYSPIPLPGMVPVTVPKKDAANLLRTSVWKPPTPPKPPSPVPAANLAVKVQTENAKNTSPLDPIYRFLGMQPKPQIVNPLLSKVQDPLGLNQ